MEREICGAVFLVENAEPFVCSLSPHEGRHCYEGRQDEHPFFIMWEGDMKERFTARLTMAYPT